MKRIPNYQIIAIIWGLLLLPSCATERSMEYSLPRDIDMNEDAGRGGSLLVTVQLDDAENYPFVLDTGMPITCFDKSLETKLGKSFGKAEVLLEGTNYDGNFCNAPKLYLGKVLLKKTGPYVVTLDCQQISSELGRRVMGILGMDVLQHYCIQLDFVANKIRFLDDKHSDKSDWGKPFSLTDIGDRRFSINENLAGTKAPGSMIDTGCIYDGWLTSKLFQQWTNKATTSKVGIAHNPNAVLGGETYPDIGLNAQDSVPGSFSSAYLNAIGLHFLSRHLVTLDFPERTMYLKRISIGPFYDTAMKAATETEGKSALDFLTKLKEAGQLPGWRKDEKSGAKTWEYGFCYPDLVTFEIPKKSNSSIYHYIFSRPNKGASWKLQKAWRTDLDGHVIEEYLGF
jgi:hypothetical protein